MNPPNPARDHYLSEITRHQERGRTSEPAWLADLRGRARDHFAENGFPTPDHEEWRYTNVAPIARTPFRPRSGPAPAAPIQEILRKMTFGEMECTHLVFVNGRYAPKLSTVRPVPPGVTLGSLARTLEGDPGRIEPHLGRHASSAGQPFTALNTALYEDGAFIYIPRGRVLPEPVHLIFIAAPDGEPMMSHPRNLIVAEEGSQAAVVESYVGPAGTPYFTNAVTESVVGDNAALDHCKLQQEGEEAYHVATLQTTLRRSASFASHLITLGGALTRNDVNMTLDAEGIECALNGLYLATGSQHIDNHTFIDHAQPHCSSREFYKGVLAGRSHGVFNGKIRVRKDAQKTDAKQTNKNLLLSEEALVDTKPQLEIFADDVKCTHGATVGQLDEEAMFYLRSRGMAEETARSLLIHAFASDIISRIPVKPVRTGLECLLMTRLPVGIELKETP